MSAIPEGKTVQELLPAFAAVIEEFGPIGEPCPVCPGCRKPFHATRLRKLAIRLYPVDSPVPFALRYDLCGSCGNAYRRGGVELEALLTSIQAFMDGEAATQ